jgi:hypothetical protein
MDYLYAAGNLLLDVPTSTVIAAVFVASAVALVTAKVYQWARRREGNGDVTALATVILLGNIVSMTVVAGYVSHREQEILRTMENASPSPTQYHFHPARFHGFRDPSGPGSPPSMTPGERAERAYERHLTRQILESADTNHDGRLSPDESSRLMETAEPRADSVKRPDANRGFDRS